MTTWAEAARDGRWADFEGLPGNLDVTTLLEALGRPVAWTERPVFLGHQERTLVESDGLRCWLRGGRVILAELEDPASELPATELLLGLGVADRRRPGPSRDGATVTDHIYSRRGLAVAVAESHHDTPAFEPFVTAVRLFSPTSLEAYLSDLGGLDRRGPRFEPGSLS